MVDAALCSEMLDEELAKRLEAAGDGAATTMRPSSSASRPKPRVSLTLSLCRPTTWSRRISPRRRTPHPPRCARRSPAPHRTAGEGDQARRTWWVRVALPSSKLGSFLGASLSA